MIEVAQVAVDGRVSGGLDPLTYLNPHGAKRGQVTLVPLGVRTVLGVVLSAGSAQESDLPVPLAKMRSLGPPISGLDLPEPLIALAEFAADEYLCPLSWAISLLLPPGLRERLASAWVRTEVPADPEDLTPLQQEVLRTVEELGGQLVGTKSKPIAAGALRALKLLRAKKLVREELSVVAKSERATLPAGLRLTRDEARVERFLREEGRKKHAQALTLMRLQGSEGVRLSPQEIRALSGVTDSTLRALLTAGLLEPAEEESYPTLAPPQLSGQQENAVQAISSAIAEARHQPFLLYGVTGSGKTEVYLHAGAEALRRGRQVLYLVPEIALTAQVISQLRGRFGSSVAVLHSNLSPQERLESWTRIAKGEAPVVLGARSALFAPLSRIGLIILDEEHEQSYKQESQPRYHTKSLARKLAQDHGAALVLGSATPSVESFWQASVGELTRLDMPDRAATATLPPVQIIDLAEQFKQPGKPSLITQPLRERITAVLERQEQAILFLNRRAYSPFLSCRECGYVFACPNCAVSLAYHKRDASLVCHYCGHRQAAPSVCDQCEGVKIAPTGTGSEKVEELLREEFPHARVARLDRDVAQRKGAVEEIFALMRAGEIDLLVGTQMVAKGLDFPGVTLVGVILADTALHLPDFRASERTFQLLCQVGGRAGRGEKPGEVLIQTFSPQHPSVVFAQTHDYLSLYESLLEEREAVNYPPFNRLVNLLMTGPERFDLIRRSDALGQALRGALPDASVLGPVDCTIERLNNQWRRHLLVKTALDTPLKALREIVDAMDLGKNQLTLDVDPYTML